AFIDASAVGVHTPGVFTNFTYDLSGIQGLADNPLFAFQIVAEFESTATGAGADGYTATKEGSSYSVNGTLRFDMLTVSGTLLADANTGPEISKLPAQILRPRQTTQPLRFTLSDAEDAPETLILAVTSSDPNIISEANLVLGGAGKERTLT